MPSVSRQITQQFSQCLFRIQTRTQSRGGRPHRLTKALQPSSQCPTGADGLIELQTLFQLQIGVSAHEALDKLLAKTVSPL